MSERFLAEGVLITGAYGTGKTSMVEEIAHILESKNVRYAAIDLDWLSWFDPGPGDHDANNPTRLRNLDAVVSNYFEAGIVRFALAGAVSSAIELAKLRHALGMPLTVVRLNLAMTEIERRLSDSATTGRQDDLRVAREWLSKGRGEGLEDFSMVNDRPLREGALEIVATLNW